MNKEKGNNVLRTTALAAALLGAYGYMPVSTAAINIVINNEQDLGSSSLSNATVTVNEGGIATGNGTKISGSAYDVVLINAGGSLTLDNAELSNNLDHPTGTNGRTIAAKGTDAYASLTDTKITITAHSTNEGVDYNHAFTAGVGAADGGHVDILGGTIEASGSKRTVGMQANDGGSINATGVTITTNDLYGHAVQAYRTPTSSEVPTNIVLDQVTIITNGSDFSLGIQSSNKGANVTATDTDITTSGINSNGVDVFNGATAQLTRGNITTTGAGAMGVRLYGGELGEGSVTVDDTKIRTSGLGAVGILAGGSSEVQSGDATISGVDILTTGEQASALRSAYGSQISSSGSTLHTEGDAAHGIYVHDGGAAVLDGDHVTTEGFHAYGLYAKDPDSTITGSDVSVATEGVYGYGARAENGGAIDLAGGSISTNNTKGQDAQDGDGSRAYAISADGEGSSVTTTNTAIVTQGQRAYGAYATNGGNVELSGESISTHGFMAYGVYASGEDSTVTTNNVDITTTGAVGDAAWAYQGGVTTINGGTILVQGNPNVNAPHESSNGVAALGGIEGVGNGVVNVNNASITTTGDDSVGALAGARVGNALTSGTINLDNTQLEVTGAGSVIASVENGSTLTATNGSRLVSVQSNGIETLNNATVMLENTVVEAAGASFLANVTRAGQVQNISVGDGSVLTKNDGTLLQVSRAPEGNEGVVNLTLSAGAVATGDIRDADGGNTRFVLDNAQWTGGLFGVSDFEIRSGASFTETGGQINTDTLAMDDGVTVAFTNGVTLTDQFVAKGGTQAHFSGASLLNAGIKVDGSTSSFTGNDATISVPGTKDMQAGVNASNGATVNITGGSVSAEGSTIRTRGILASTGANVTTNNTDISTTAAKSHAVHAFVETNNTAAAVPVVTLNGGTVSTSGNESWGLYALRGGEIASSADITTSGQAGFGAFVEGNDEANARGGKITLNGGSITTTGQQLAGTEIGSFGVLAKNAGSHVEIDGTRIQTSGAYADGLRAEDNATINSTNAHVATTGANAHGVALTSGGSATVNGGSINASGEGSSGLLLDNQGTATLNGVQVVSSGASITSQFSEAQQQQINVGALSDLTQNNGTLLLVNREPGGEEGTVLLNLQSGSFSAGNVLDQDGSKRVVVNKDADAHWAGIVIDQTTRLVPDGGSQEYSNELIDGDIASGNGSTVHFDNGANIEGSVSSGVNSIAIFNGATNIGGNVAGQQGSTGTFSGPTNIGGAVTVASNSTMAFNGPTTTIGGSVAGAQNTNFSFSGPTAIGGSAVGGQGTQMVFSEGATIAQNVQGTGSSFVFSQTAPTTIGGAVQLAQGASLRGGSASAPITIAGNTSVTSGAVLAGNLIIGGDLSANGAILAPGNSIGSFQVSSLSQAVNSSYVVEVNAAGQSDLLTVTSGNVDLTGITLEVSQENGNGGYRLNHDYTILETGKADGISAVANNQFAGQGLDNTFDGTLVMLDPVKYGDNTVKISLSTDQDAVETVRDGLNRNQNATLDGVLSVQGQNASADAALLSTNTQDALNQLSGDVHASTQTALLSSNYLVSRTLSDRMRANLGTTADSTASATYPLWAQVVGSWNELDGKHGAAKAKSEMTGLFVGGDVQVGAGWRLGAALGYTDGKVKVNDRSSKSDVKSYTAALYGGNSWATDNGQINFLAGAAHTKHEVDSRRTVTVGGSQTLKADYDINSTQLFTELGYALPVGQASVLQPYAGVAWISQKAKSFAESGGSAALSGSSQTDDVTTFTLGLRAATTVATGESEARLTAGLGWRHASGDVDTTRSMSFIQGGGAAFRIAGAPVMKNAAVVDLGAEMSVGKSAALGLSYSGQFGDGNSDNAGTVHLRVRF